MQPIKGALAKLPVSQAPTLPFSLCPWNLLLLHLHEHYSEPWDIPPVLLTTGTKRHPHGLQSQSGLVKASVAMSADSCDEYELEFVLEFARRNVREVPVTDCGHQMKAKNLSVTFQFAFHAYFPLETPTSSGQLPTADMLACRSFRVREVRFPCKSWDLCESPPCLPFRSSSSLRDGLARPQPSLSSCFVARFSILGSWMRVQSRSKTRLRIAASIAFSFHACLKANLETIAPQSRCWALGGLERGGWERLPVWMRDRAR